ncbi:hypothetical protein [Caldicellulosiruptor naganoensis]|uniref:Uncharacterized protein n=1 Tax=Caldicellulosiruptor naganoensis TaxID=29324 RepID=A0ABY7BNG5_9FIRM|nr:hypothetical protein [Caldicellulosiruptor naganoensis]WAM32566.1 hypothetical protein OTJ99_001139 [Caldicellulosiruptor naganoensis]
MDIKRILALAFFVLLILVWELCKASEISKSFIDKVKLAIDKTTDNDTRDYI